MNQYELERYLSVSNYNILVRKLEGTARNNMVDNTICYINDVIPYDWGYLCTTCLFAMYKGMLRHLFIEAHIYPRHAIPDKYNSVRWTIVSSPDTESVYEKLYNKQLSF